MKKIADVRRFITSRFKLPRGDDKEVKTQVDSNKEEVKAPGFTFEDMGFSNLIAKFDKSKRVLYNRGRGERAL